MVVPDPVLAFMLLASSGLWESDVQLVMSAIEKIYDNMKNVLKRVFSSGITTSPSSNFNALKTEVKVKPVLHSNSEATSSSDSVFITQGNQRYRGKPSYNKGYSNQRGRGKRGPLTGSNMERVPNYDRKLNRTGPNGEVSRCLVCDSRFHWARDCPHSCENNNNDDDDKPQAVHLSLFMGFAKEDKSTKLQSLVCQIVNQNAVLC